MYDYVCGCTEPAGRDEVAAATGYGRPLAAYHLDKLTELGLLTASYRRPAGRGGPGAGRPAKVYARSAREFCVTVPPREYELAAKLLTDAVASEPTGAAMTELDRSARRAGAELAGSVPAQDVREILAAHGFEPCQDEAGVVRLRNCPFHQLAARHPGIVCAMNLALLQGVLAGTGATGLRATLDPGPGRCCVAITSSEETDQGAQ